MAFPDGDEASTHNTFTWGTHAVVDEQWVVKAPAGTASDLGAVIGCALMTGAGAVMNTAAVRAGQSVVVWGTGGVGLCALAGAAILGAAPVIAVDIDPRVVDTINDGRSHVGDEPGLAELVADAHAAGRLRATTDAAAAAGESDVVLFIVPIMLDDAARPDRRSMDAAVNAVAPGLRPGSLVIFETTLPVGDTRDHYALRLESITGLRADVAGDDGLYVAFSP